MTAPRRTRIKARPPASRKGGIIDRIRRQLALVHAALVELDEQGGAAQERARLQARFHGLRSQLASALGDSVESERASQEALRWQAEARLPEPPPFTSSSTDAELDAAAQKAARFLLDARASMLAAGFPAAAVDQVFEEAKPSDSWRPTSIPALVAAATHAFDEPTPTVLAPAIDIAVGIAAVDVEPDDID